MKTILFGLVMGIAVGFIFPGTQCHADELTCMAGCNDSMPKMVTYDRVRVTGANRVARNVYSTERDASGVLTSKGGFTYTHTSAAGLTSTTTVTRN